MLLTVVSWSILRGPGEGLRWAVIGGLCLDVLSGGVFGLQTLALLLVSLVVSLGEVRIFRSHIAMPLASASGATLLYYLVNMGLLYLLGYSPAWLIAAEKVVLPAMIVNTLAMFLVYPALHWLHKATGREELAW
jgi:rod shape-determining protein MreD